MTSPTPSPIPSPTMPGRRRLALAVLVAAIATAGLLSCLGPGRTDLPVAARTGAIAADDGYWTSPLRRVAGTGRQDVFDDRLALSLALPENAIGALAWRLGVPAEDARFAGSALALFATVLAAILYARVVPLLLLAFLLLAAPILAHVRSDLGEGTAFGIASLFGFAMVRRRIGLAAFLAGIGIFQKACGLALGVGVLVAVLLGPGRMRRLGVAALGSTLGVVLCAAIASLAFGDDPISFVLRPFLATGDTRAAIDLRSIIAHAAFPSAYGVAGEFIWVITAAWIALPHFRPGAPLIVAAFAGFAFAGLFPDPWRILPSWMLLPALVAVPRALDERPRLDPWGSLLSAFLLVQCAVALPGMRGHSAPSPRALLAIGAVAVGIDLWRARSPASRKTASVLGLVLVGIAAPFVLSAVAVLRDCKTDRRQFAELVARQLPADAHLVAYSYVATSFHGTLYYPPFQSLWEDEIAASDGPRTLYRLRSTNRVDDAPPEAPSGFRVEQSQFLSITPYGAVRATETMMLDTMTRR